MDFEKDSEKDLALCNMRSQSEIEDLIWSEITSFTEEGEAIGVLAVLRRLDLD